MRPLYPQDRLHPPPQLLHPPLVLPAPVPEFVLQLLSQEVGLPLPYPLHLRSLLPEPSLHSILNQVYIKFIYIIIH